MELYEVDSQEYAGNHCVFSSGLTNHPIDTIYLQWRKDGDEEGYTLFLRPDEATRIAALLSNAVWSQLVKELKA